MSGLVIQPLTKLVNLAPESVHIQDQVKNVTLTDPDQSVTLVESRPSIAIQAAPPLLIQDVQKVISIMSSPSMSTAMRVIPFFFSATAGQTRFTLSIPANQSGLFIVAINTAMQYQSKGDFTIDGNDIVFNAPMEDGDEVGGVYEKAL